VEEVSNDLAPDVVEANVFLIYNRGIEHSVPMITGRTIYWEPFLPVRPIFERLRPSRNQ